MIPALLLALLQAPADTVPLTAGMVITHSVTIRPGTYRIPGGDSLDTPVVTIRGNDITVDFAGAVLQGMDPAADPDQATGLGVLVDGGRDITVRNLRVRGYKVGLLARGTRDLHVLDSDFSHNWKPRLFSGITHESLMDWLSHHHNEQGEWLRFGAGIYLDGVRGGVIARNRIEQGMEGLMLTRTDSMEISRNVIEHNSGIGIGLYRSSWNRIVHNRASFNVRGYSHGFFRRGQDSANLLLYEQSSRNFVAWNTMTHGGDGLFLWAGQHTMDTGEGGSNDNLFVGNDFSFAPTNAMEATFSRNRFVGNRAWGSDHGLWGGYSFESQVVGNDFRGNRRAIALEHGQDNLIARNRFNGDSVGIHLWANPIEPSDWGYPKHRDTRSRDVRILDNKFGVMRVGTRIANTTGVRLDGNSFVLVDTLVVMGDSVVTGSGTLPVDPLPMPHPRGGREAIIVDAWGPYDWRSPKLWPVGSGDSVPVRLRVLGPAGGWRLRDTTHVVTLSATSGRVGDTLVVTPARGHEDDWRVRLVYEGEAVVLPNGLRHAAGEPVLFRWRRFRPIATWTLSLHTWDEEQNPLASDAQWNDVVRGEPVARCTRTHLDVVGYRPMFCDVRAERLAVAGRAEVNLGPGRYTLRTISDDAIRVWVDDELVIDAWAPHGSEVHTAPMSPGRHEIRMAYAQREGWMELRVDVVEGDQRSTGSPGPH